MKLRRIGSVYLFPIILIAIFLIGLLRAYVRVQTTLIGYELGKLKKIEAMAFESRSQLQMELAKITTKENLLMLSKSNKELGEKR